MGALDIETADQLGRELAWVWARNQGMITPQMAKEAGLLEGFIYAPLSALAALFTAPWGSKWRSAGLGLLLGAGLAATTGKEVEKRRSRGEEVQAQDLSPLLKAVLGGLSIAGGARVIKSIREGKEIGTGASILAAAPVGALIHSSNPIVGALVAGEGAAILSALRGGKKEKEEEEAYRPKIEARLPPMSDVLSDISKKRPPFLIPAAIPAETVVDRPGLLTSEDISRRIEEGKPFASKGPLPFAPGLAQTLLSDGSGR